MTRLVLFSLAGPLYLQLQQRQRAADGAGTTLLPGAYLADVEAITTSRYEALDQVGFRPTLALQWLRAVSFDEEQASIMGVDVGTPGC